MTEEEKEMERKVEMFTEIAKVAEQEAMQVTKKDVETVVKKLKRGEAGDSRGWKNEMLQGSHEMIRSLVKLFNKILQEKQVPSQWREVKIKVLHKSGSRMKTENKRGIFLTSIIGKAFGIVIDRRVTLKMDEGQVGGRQRRGTADALLLIKEAVENNKRFKQRTTIVFADAVKCFDRLWLKDCVVDLVRAGMRAREAMIIYEMNKNTKATVLTPAGEPEEIEVGECVRQGSVWGQQYARNTQLKESALDPS